MSQATEQALQAVVGTGGNQTPDQLRQRIVANIMSAQNGLNQLAASKTKVDDAVTETSDEIFSNVQSGWAAALVKEFNKLSGSGPASIIAVAQFIADLSEQAGLDGGVNELRVFQGNASPTKISVSQDA